jgi:hypothetical protein
MEQDFRSRLSKKKFSGLKGRDIPAQGEALGLARNGAKPREGRDKFFLLKFYRALSGLDPFFIFSPGFQTFYLDEDGCGIGIEQ